MSNNGPLNGAEMFLNEDHHNLNDSEYDLCFVVEDIEFLTFK
jgi:hypothetical protein